ncbi:Protein of unknown function [Pyronema omphalodes CBS 100304]|uniref:Uncharacterized protein n=1 Tax=Pyronema omphalodes (strain CBS 100304) TaxID=1076935 RepID=U4KXY0_PYROM|nr:Protein of unknown function [Pyronema omphalodes CBS 100304]
MALRLIMTTLAAKSLGRSSKYSEIPLLLKTIASSSQASATILPFT